MRLLDGIVRQVFWRRHLRKSFSDYAYVLERLPCQKQHGNFGKRQLQQTEVGKRQQWICEFAAMQVAS